MSAKKNMDLIRSAYEDGIKKGDIEYPTGEKVAIRHTYRGTHTGTYMGVPPTGKAVKVSANDLYHLKDGQIVEEWSEFDLLGVLQQIGAIPPMPVGP